MFRFGTLLSHNVAYEQDYLSNSYKSVSWARLTQVNVNIPNACYVFIGKTGNSQFVNSAIAARQRLGFKEGI